MSRIRKLFSPLLVLQLAVFMAVQPAAADRKHGDIDKIGNRDVAGRIWGIFPNFISLEKEIEIGAQIAGQFEQTAKLLDDPVVVEYIDRVGQNIVKHSDAKVPFHIKVVDTDEVNAFALPGGYFYVNKGLILAAENEAELAGVMAHEISHVAARHATRRLSKAQILQFATIPIFIFGPPLGSLAGAGIYNALGLSINLGVLGITRESEKEADQLGIQYLWNTGYDPEAFVTFFEKLKAQEKEKPGKFAGFFRTHPSTDDRINLANQELKYLPPKPEYIVNSSDFDLVKARIVALDNPVKLEGGQTIGPAEKKRPTLKRRTAGGDDGESERPTLKKEGGKEGDQERGKERPTLKRPGDKDN